MQNVYATLVSTGASCEYLLMAVVVGFHCDVVSCKLARRGVWRGAAEACGSGADKRMWAWSRGRSDLYPQSRAILPTFMLRPKPRQYLSLLVAGTLSRILSGIQRAAQTASGVDSKRTCSRGINASNAVGVLKDNALYR